MLPEADYELDTVAAGQVAQPKNGQPKPNVTTLTLSLERKQWTERPNGTYTVAVGLTAERDPAFPTSTQLDQLHRLLRGRLNHFLDVAQASDTTPNGGQ